MIARRVNFPGFVSRSRWPVPLSFFRATPLVNRKIAASATMSSIYENIENKSLLKSTHFINGEWKSRTDKVYKVRACACVPRKSAHQRMKSRSLVAFINSSFESVHFLYGIQSFEFRGIARAGRKPCS
jgi:hypothetical protein